MEIVFYIVGFLFLILLVVGIPLAIVQYKTATKELKKLETKSKSIRIIE